MTAERIYGDDWLTDDERAQLAALRAKPRLSMYDQDEVDTFSQLAGIRSATERMTPCREMSVSGLWRG
jgi:hypothetical protein